MEFKVALKLCSTLQQKLKDEYFLLTSEQDQKTRLQNKLNDDLKKYFQYVIQPNQSNVTKNTEHHRQLFEDDGFGNCYNFIKSTILSLAKNPQICLAIIKKYNNEENLQKFKAVIKIIVTIMYENIVDDELANKDIIVFIKGIIQFIVQSKSQLSQYQFNDTTFVFAILREFTKKSEYNSYAQQVIKSTQLQLAKTLKIIDFKNIEEYQLTKSTKDIPKKIQSPSKIKQQSNLSLSLSTFSNKIPFSKSEAYSDALRKKDQKLKSRTKNRNYVSTELMQYLGINDSVNIPTFSCSSNQQILKQEEQINYQWSLILDKKDSKKSGIGDITQLKNLVFTFFSELFKMLYSMPISMRIICNILYQLLMAKYKQKKMCLSVVGNFVIGFWITSLLKTEDKQLQSSKRINSRILKNGLLVKQVILGIVQNSQTDIHQAFRSQFKIISSNLRISVINYLSQLINIEIPPLKTSLQATKIKSYSVCLSIQDVSRFLQMIKNSSEEINKMDPKLIKNVQKIYQISQGSDIFGLRKDKYTNKQYKDYQAYVLFQDLVLPKQLSFDYSKFYADAFKKQKIKNLLRQVLLNISDIEQFGDFSGDCINLREFFLNILKTKQQHQNMHSLDSIPVQLKINYLTSVTKTVNLQQFLQSMLKQVQQRLLYLQNIWDKSKKCYLSAIASIQKQNQKILYNDQFIKEQQKKKKIDEFNKKYKIISLCLTSQKSRQDFNQTNILKDYSQDYNLKLWLDQQKQCIHNLFNSQFIKSYIGQISTSKYQPHFYTPNQFPQKFCSLPEIKQKWMNQNDTIGMKDVISKFLQYCIKAIKNNNDFLILAKDQKWLQQHLQQKVSKKLYDKLYPKMPTYDDLGLYFRLKTLDWVGYEHLKIDQFLRVDGLWDIAAKQLKKIDKMKTASQKLNCIVECCEIINKSFALIDIKERPISAEDLFPIVVYVVIKAAPRRLISNLHFVDMFSNQNRLMSKDGYCFTQLKSAVHYCKTLNYDNLGMEMIEFNKKIYQKQIEYGIYFLLNRQKDSPRMMNKKIDYIKKYCQKQQQNLKKKEKQ